MVLLTTIITYPHAALHWSQYLLLRAMAYWHGLNIARICTAEAHAVAAAAQLDRTQQETARYLSYTPD